MAAFNTPSIPLPSVVVVPNNETVGGTLAVTGATTLASTLAVTGSVGIGIATPNVKTQIDVAATGIGYDLLVTNSATPAVNNTARVSLAPIAIGAAYNLAPYVEGIEENTGSNIMGLALGTYTGAAIGERMRITGAGNVGIGTTSPTALLQVNDVTNNGAAATILPRLVANYTATAGSGAAINFTDTANNVLGQFRSITESAGNIGLAFSTYNGASSEKVRISAAGNVGIGTTTPTNVLEVKADTSRFFCATNPTTSLTAKQISIGESSNNSNFRLQLGYFTDGAYKGSIQSLDNSVGSSLAINANGGNVGIGTATPSYVLHVNTDSAGKPGAGGLWTVVSDERIKTDIVPADLDRCYEIVKSVPLKHFGFKPGVYTDEQIQDKHSLGWIAQDVQQVFEKAVSVKPFTVHTPQPDGTVQDDVIEDCLDLNSGQMIAALYGCVQALMAKVEALEARG